MKAKARKSKITVQDVIEIDCLVMGKHRGWIHTHGMDKFNLPELEMRDVPLMLV